MFTLLLRLPRRRWRIRTADVANVRHHQDRADRAEKWLYQISVEIEEKFFGSDENRPSQNQRR